MRRQDDSDLDKSAVTPNRWWGFTTVLRSVLVIVLAILASFAAAEGEVTWSAKPERSDVRAGEVVRIVVDAKLKPGWHTYSIVPVPEGPFATLIKPPTGDAVAQAGAVSEQKPHEEFDKNFGKKVGLFSDSAEFYVPVKIKEGKSGPQKLAVNLVFQTCNDQICIPPKPVNLSVDVDLVAGAARPEFSKLDSPPATAASDSSGSGDATTDQIKKAQSSGWPAFILLSFLAGLASLLTPCVFPMIPITVSFFSKQKSEDGKLNFAGPIAYCTGIIATFTLLGVLVGSTGLNKIATNVWVNVGLAALFVVLAASLFGVFEIRLPSALINAANRKSRSGGLVGPLVMGLTFTLTSFTCTVPFVGTLLAASAQSGLSYAIVGMLAYSTAFALPFFLLALFPSALSKLPRSGAWLVTVKAYMGFLELMAALKFLSNVDLTFSLAWLTRPVFLAVWAGIAAVGGLYLLGWVRLPHDGDVKVGWIRRVFAVATLALAIFCLSGIAGRRLGTLASFLPPDPYPGQGSGMWKENYDSALKEAQASGKNVFIDFTGIYCTNCRDIEENVFTQPQVDTVLKQFVLVRLFTDKQTPETDANQQLQRRLASVDSLPLYVVVSPSGKVLKVHQQAPPIEDAKQFLDAIKPYTGAMVASR